jgi:hypothetical protein
MAGPDRFDDTSTDHEQLETELLAQDRDAANVATADVDGKTARGQVDKLIEGDIVTPIPEDRVLVHEPSGTAFDSTTQLAVFHRGWTAGRDGDTEGE